MGLTILQTGTLKETAPGHHVITIQFADGGEHAGDLDIFFSVNESNEMDVLFTVPFFLKQTEYGEQYMEEAEAMQVIFSRFASEVQTVIDQVLDALYEQLDQKG